MRTYKKPDFADVFSVHPAESGFLCALVYFFTELIVQKNIVN